MPGQQCHQDQGILCHEPFAKGERCNFEFFFLFFLTVHLTKMKQSCFWQALLCVWLGAEPGGGGFPLSLSVFETGMGAEELVG